MARTRARAEKVESDEDPITDDRIEDESASSGREASSAWVTASGC